MNTEIELCLSLPPGQQAAFRRRVMHLLPGACKPHDSLLQAIYFDTPDLVLCRHRMGLRLRHQDGQWVQTIKAGQPGTGGALSARTEVEHVARGAELELDRIPHRKLRTFLGSSRIAPHLQPVFSTCIRRTHWLVADNEGNVVELALDIGDIECDGRRLPVHEIEIELKQGRMEAVFSIGKHLARVFSLLPQVASKAERGYRLFTRQMVQPVLAGTSPVKATQSVSQARHAIMLECLHQFQANVVEILHDDRPEFVHQARIALRRLHAADKIFSSLQPPPQWLQLRHALQPLGRCLGAVRDVDVMLQETLPAAAAVPHADTECETLYSPLRAQHAVHLQALRNELADPATGLLLLQLLECLHAWPEPEATPPTSALTAFAAKALQRSAGKAHDMASQWADLDVQQRHALRKRLKQLRYGTEFFAPLFARRRVRHYLKDLHALQDALGTLNDGHVLAAAMQELARRDPACAYAAGWLAGWQGAHATMVQQRMAGILHAWQAQSPFWSR